MFYCRAKSFIQDISSWNTSKITDIRFIQIHYVCSTKIFHRDTIATVTMMKCMYYRTVQNMLQPRYFVVGYRKCDEDTDNIFCEAWSFDHQDLSSWNTARVRCMKYCTCSSMLHPSIKTFLVGVGIRLKLRLLGDSSGAASFDQEIGIVHWT